MVLLCALSRDEGALNLLHDLGLCSLKVIFCGQVFCDLASYFLDEFTQLVIFSFYKLSFSEFRHLLFQYQKLSFRHKILLIIIILLSWQQLSESVLKALL